MTAAERYISHLTRILDECDDTDQFCDASGEALQKFFDEIAADRIRIGKTNWQGHDLKALLWNLPNLKPSSQAALIRHVADRWHAHKTGVTVDSLETDAVGQIGSPTISTDLGQADSVTDTCVGGTPNKQPAALSILTGTTDVRRDWFDCLTDWVAAIVSLWK